ncbi:MAG TPA: RNA methyltransferase [Terriglobia bacterium]|jgi:TrmH family RNA methyltransferase
MQIGKHNRKLVEVRKAFQHGTLTADGLLPIEGPILVEEASRSGLQIVDLFIREGTKNPGIVAEMHDEIPQDLFKSIQDTEHSQGLIATVRLREFTFDGLLGASPALIVVLARLQDPGNVGTILRIAESFGATGCAATPGTVSFYNSKAVRASAGSVFRLPHVAGIGFEALTAELRRRQIAIVGTSPAAEIAIEQWDWKKPSAMLIGNEGGGLAPDEMSACDTVLRIPQKRTVESLNSAVAAAVTLYEASKQRRSE